MRLINPFPPWSWLLGVTPKGKGMRLGPWNSDGDARKEADRLHLSNVQVFSLRTKDASKAAQEIRFLQLKQGNRTVDDVLQRMKRRPDAEDEAIASGSRPGGIRGLFGGGKERRDAELDFDDDEDD